jgi:hypothetical protein
LIIARGCAHTLATNSRRCRKVHVTLSDVEHFVVVQEEAARWERRAMRMEEQVEESMGRDHELRCESCAINLHL